MLIHCSAVITATDILGKKCMPLCYREQFAYPNSEELGYVTHGCQLAQHPPLLSVFFSFFVVFSLSFSRTFIQSGLSFVCQSIRALSLQLIGPWLKAIPLFPPLVPLLLHPHPWINKKINRLSFSCRCHSQISRLVADCAAASSPGFVVSLLWNWKFCICTAQKGK